MKYNEKDLRPIKILYRKLIFLFSSILDYLGERAGVLTWFTILIGAVLFYFNFSLVSNEKLQLLTEESQALQIELENRENLYSKIQHLEDEMEGLLRSKSIEKRQTRSDILDRVVRAFVSYKEARQNILMSIIIQELYVDLGKYFVEKDIDAYFFPNRAVEEAQQEALNFFRLKTTDFNLGPLLNELFESLRFVPSNFSYNSTQSADKLRIALMDDGEILKNRYLNLARDIKTEDIANVFDHKINALKADFEELPRDETLGIILPVIWNRFDERGSIQWPSDEVFDKMRISMRHEVHTGLKPYKIEEFILHGPIGNHFPFYTEKGVLLEAEQMNDGRFKIVRQSLRSNSASFYDYAADDNIFNFVIPIYSDDFGYFQDEKTKGFFVNIEFGSGVTRPKN